MGLFPSRDHAITKVRQDLLVSTKWKDGRFATTLKHIGRYQVKVDAAELDLKGPRVFLNSKRDFFLGLLENPMLVEHENFSDSLLRVFHLLDELSSRDELSALPESDIKHLTGDVNRAYKELMVQWVTYLRHLKGEYPYLSLSR